MKRGTKTWTVDWGREGRGPAAPRIGHVVRKVSAKGVVTGYCRVVAVRQVRTRKPLPEHYDARYRVGFEDLADRPPEGVDWTCHVHPRKPKPPPALDRFSPLLDA